MTERSQRPPFCSHFITHLTPNQGSHVTPFVETRAEKKRQRQNAARAMEEAALPRTGGERREALDATEQREETAMRVEHAAQVERLQRRLVMEALGVRGGSSDEVRPKWYPQPKSSDFAHEPTEPTGRVTSVQLSHLHVPPAESQTRANTKH